MTEEDVISISSLERSLNPYHNMQVDRCCTARKRICAMTRAISEAIHQIIEGKFPPLKTIGHRK